MQAVGKILKPVTSLLSPEIPEVPEITAAPGAKEALAPTVAPVADQAALAKARQRTAAKRGSGRASTVLSLGSGAGKKKTGG